MSLRLARTNWLKALAIGSVAALYGCNDSSNDRTEATTSVTGSIFAAPVRGASVRVQDGNGNDIAGPVTSAADGSYTIEVPTSSLSGNLIFTASGGSYTDEASGMSTTAGTLSAYVPGGTLAAGSQVHATPGSTIVQRLIAQYGLSQTAAETAFSNTFGYTPDSGLAPTDATNPATGASEAQKLAGLRAAAFSQLASDMSADHADLLAALAQDLSDGELDGRDASGDVALGSAMLPADIHNRFATALVNFRNGGNDGTGLANDKIGTLPFAKMALTNSYKIEYVPSMMAAMEGKTSFKLRISDHSDQPQSGLSVSLMPMMYMAMHHHSSPVGGCTESATAGEYDCSVYYLMGSTMMSGMSMGYWQLKVMVGGMMGESASFYPSVMMAMGNTAKAVLKGQADQIAGMAMDGGMAMPENRSYYLFSEGLSGIGDNRTFKLFLAAKESMMAYPAVTLGTVLSQGDASYELTIASMSLEVSSNGTDWIAATDSGNGHWSVTGIAGLVNDVQGSIYVRLSINGETKTTDGATPMAAGSNDHATFMITPGMSM